jgi:hypothetical protein
MDREPPPSQPPSQSPRNRAVDLSRGTLRDALGSLGNLALLAGSAKVGSKAISGVLPDVLASCAPMREATREMLRALAPWLAAHPAVVKELEDFALPRMQELEAELSARIGEPLRASERLGLDRVLGRLSRELDAAQALIELLEVATQETRLPLSVAEVLRQRLPAAPSGRRPRGKFSVRLVIAGKLPDVPMRPRAFTGLVGALLEAADAPGRASLTLRPDGDGVELTISSDAALAGEELMVWAYGVIPPSQTALEATAALSGVHLERIGSATRIQIPAQ